jgi:hypothetical protein
VISNATVEATDHCHFACLVWDIGALNPACDALNQVLRAERVGMHGECASKTVPGLLPAVLLDLDVYCRTLSTKDLDTARKRFALKSMDSRRLGAIAAVLMWERYSVADEALV